MPRTKYSSSQNFNLTKSLFVSKATPQKQLSLPTPKQYSVRRRRPGMRVLQEIRRLQNSTDLLIPKLPFARVVREITEKHWPYEEPFRYTVQALLALQTAAEAYLVGMLEDSSLCSVHAKRITLQVKDIHLALRIRGRLML